MLTVLTMVKIKITDVIVAAHSKNFRILILCQVVNLDFTRYE